jgi:WD40 repeat protein
MQEKPRAPTPQPPEKKETLTATRLDEFPAAFPFVQLALSPDGKRLAYVGHDIYVELRQEGDSAPPIRLEDPGGLQGSSVAISPDGQTVAAGWADGAVSLWKIDTPSPPRNIKAGDGRVYDLSFSVDGQTLASGSYDKNNKAVKLWKAETGETVGQPVQVSHDDTILDLNATKRLVAVWTAGGELQLWSFGGEAGVTKATLSKESEAKAEPAGAFSSDGQWLATGDGDGFIKVWWVDENNNAALAGEMRPQDLKVDALSFSSNGGALAAGWADGTLIVWAQPFGVDAPTAEFRAEPGSAVMAFDESGETLAEGRLHLDAKGNVAVPGVHSSIRLWRVRKEAAK